MSSHSSPGASVSVIIPAYNSSATIVAALESVFAQTVAPGEVIVVDDGSIDDVYEKIRRFDDRVRFFRQVNAGAAAARNRAAAAATGELLAFLDADDMWHSTKLARQLDVFREHADLAICRTRFSLMPLGGRFDATAPVASGPVVVSTAFPDVFLDPYFGTPTVMMRRSVFESCGGFDVSLETAEDVDLWLRASYGRTVAHIKEPLVCVTTSPTSLTARSGGRTDPDNLQVIESFVARYPEFGDRYPRVVRQARATVLTRMASTALSADDRTEARRLLRASLAQNPFSSRALYLFARSFVRREADG